MGIQVTMQWEQGVHNPFPAHYFFHSRLVFPNYLSFVGFKTGSSMNDLNLGGGQWLRWMFTKFSTSPCPERVNLNNPDWRTIENSSCKPQPATFGYPCFVFVKPFKVVDCARLARILHTYMPIMLKNRKYSHVHKYNFGIGLH